MNPSREEGARFGSRSAKGETIFNYAESSNPHKNPQHVCVCVGVCVSALLNGKKQPSFSFIYFFVRAFGDGFAPEEKNTFHSLCVGSSSTANSGGNVTAISRLCVCVQFANIALHSSTPRVLAAWIEMDLRSSAMVFLVCFPHFPKDLPHGDGAGLMRVGLVQKPFPHSTLGKCFSSHFNCLIEFCSAACAQL